MTSMFRLLVILSCVATCYSIFDKNYKTEINKVLEDVINKYQNGVLHISNSDCVWQIKQFLRNLLKPTIEDLWALRMIDASAKPITGIMDLRPDWPGSFDECLRINSTLSKVKGKYCLVSIAVQNVDSSLQNLRKIQEARELLLRKSVNKHIKTQYAIFPSLGICIPDKCTDEDLQTILQGFLNIIPWNVTCQTNETSTLDTGAILTLTVFAIFLAIMLLSTIYDLLQQNRNRKPNTLLVAFSVFTNGEKLFQVSKDSSELSCLHGIKVLSMAWIIFGHLFFENVLGPIYNIPDIVKFLTQERSMFIANAPFAVDTFFVVTGMLVVYGFMKSIYAGYKFNIIVFYLHRYLRLTPALIPVILSSIFLVKYLGFGPYHPQLDGVISRPCRDNWWSALLYIQNYLEDSSTGINMCVAQTWYVDVDFQLYLLSPIFLLFLPKHPKIGLTIMVLGMMSSMVAGFAVTWHKNLQAIFTDYHRSPTTVYNKYYYLQTHTRASTWFIGGFLGYILANIKFKQNLAAFKMPIWIAGPLWMIVIAAIPAIIFSGFDILTEVNHSQHSYVNSLYNTFARPIWGLCIAWVIFACSTGYGGIINRFLSWSRFQIVSRFTYTIYLLHLPIITIISYSQKQPAYFSLFNLALNFWGNTALIFGVSIFWVLAFESPIIALEKHLLEGHKNRKLGENKVPDNTTNGSVAKGTEDQTDVFAA